MTLPAPPGWAVALLGRVLPPEDREAMLLDMEELFRARVTRDGPGAARRWYARNALRFYLALAQVGATRRRVGGTLLGHGEGMMRGMGRESMRAGRRLVRAPVFAVVSILTVAVGMGSFTSVYSVVDSVLLDPPPYQAPERLVWVWRDYWFGLHRGWLGGPDITDLRAHDDVFTDVVAFRTGGTTLTGRGGDNPRRVQAMTTSAGFLDLLGVEPALGRGFAPGEDRPEAPAVALLGHDLWQSHFGGDPGVVGRDIYLDGEATTVVGVMPEDFHFVRHSSLGEPAPADLYTPMRIDLAAEDPGSGAFAGLARVREGVPQAQVAAAIDAVAQDLDDLWGNPGLKMWGVGLEDDLVASVRPALLTLLAAATFLLVILGANLATLLLGRAVARDRELAVLSALGAARGQLLQSLLAESVVIAGVGGAVGIGLAAVGVDAIRSLAPADLPRRFELAVDPSVVMVALAGAAAMALAAGLLPALRWLRGEVAQRIRETAGRTGGGVVATRTRSALVVLQVALSLMLLVSAGLLTRAYAGLLGADPGFDVRPALTFDVSLDQARYDSGAKVTDFDGRFRDAVAALPGVVDVGGADALPLSAEASQMDVAFPGAPGNTGTKDEDSPLVDYFFVGAGYGEAVGMRLLEGRWLTSADDRDAPPVLLIDDLLASRFFPDGTAAGSRVSFGGTDFAIAGVVDHARHYTVAADDRPQLYLPVARTVPRSLSYVVAVDGDPSPYGEQVRRILDALDPGVPMSDVSTLEDLVRGSLGRERLSLTLLLAFALGALLLATLGIYGVVANGVAQRTHEMGVRMALGAGRGRVVSLVLGQGLRLTLWGTALGVGGSLAASRLLEGVAVGVEPGDPAVYGIVALGLTALTGVAAWIPARRATRIDPVEALRNA